MEKIKRSKKPYKETKVLAFVEWMITIPIAIKVGKQYTDERKLFKEILKEIPLDKKIYIIGDGLYGMDSKLSKFLLEEYRLTPVIPVKKE